MLVHQKLVEFFKGFQTGAHPMAILTGVFGALSAFMHNDFDIKDPKDRELAAIRIIAKLPTIAAIAFRTANVIIRDCFLESSNFIHNRDYQLFIHKRNMVLLKISCT